MSAPDGYRLVFTEDFTNLENWNFDVGSGAKGLWGNHEKEFYTDRRDNIYVKDHKLYIIARKEKFQDCDYTSARITTKDRHYFKYGYIEISAKTPTGRGSWPALWMMGQEGAWPYCGEIDIMEHIGRDQDMIYHTLHAQNHICQPDFSHKEKVPGVSESFHKYAVLWEKNYVEFFVDDKSCGKIVNTKYSSREDWPFNEYFYLLINLAVGGDFAGDIDNKDLPFTFVVEYVKVYQKPE